MQNFEHSHSNSVLVMYLLIYIYGQLWQSVKVDMFIASDKLFIIKIRSIARH